MLISKDSIFNCQIGHFIIKKDDNGVYKNYIFINEAVDSQAYLDHILKLRADKKISEFNYALIFSYLKGSSDPYLTVDPFISKSPVTLEEINYVVSSVGDDNLINQFSNVSSVREAMDLLEEMGFYLYLKVSSNLE